MLIHWPACSKFNSHILHFKKVVYNFKSVLIIEQSFPNLKRSWRNGPLANWAKLGLTFPLECLGWNPGCLPDCNSLLMQTQAGKQVTAQWVGSWQYTWETWTEFLAPGFGLAQSQQLQALGSEPTDVGLSPTLSLSLTFSLLLKINEEIFFLQVVSKKITHWGHLFP